MDCPIPGRGGSPPPSPPFCYLANPFVTTPPHSFRHPVSLPFAIISLASLLSPPLSSLLWEYVLESWGGEVGLNPPPSLTGVQGFKTRRPYLYTPFYFKCWQQNDKHQMTLLRVPIADFFLRLLGPVVVRCSPPPPPPPLPRRRLLAYLPFWLEKHSSLIYWERKLEKRSGGKVSFWKVPTT